MLLRRRPPGIESHPYQHPAGLEHINPEWIAVLRWLSANRVEYVAIGPVARAIRGDTEADGPVALVPAPYGRNLDRLAHALNSAHARLRIDGVGGEDTAAAENTAVKLGAEKLSRGIRWRLRCGAYDVDVEGALARAEEAPAGAPDYQELLYEAGRFALEPGLNVQVASPEDIERFDHLYRTGVAPEIKITRNTKLEHGSGQAQ
jgi:hypothetical protein